ncbi:hypothetical protein ACFL59_10080 [Planctomycetota bacterium]
MRTRPKGLLKPWLKQAEGALAAQKAGVMEAAWDLCRSIPTAKPDGEAWRRYVEGILAASSGRNDLAQQALGRAGAVAEIRAKHLEKEGDPRARRTYRLAALAYHRLGLVYRSSEGAERAIGAYKDAFEYRKSYGSPAECWETTLSLRVACVEANRPEEALQWSLAALEEAESFAAQNDRAVAMSWNAIAISLGALDRFREAASASLNARTFWQRTGSPERIAQASEALGDANVVWGRSLLDTDPGAGRERLLQAKEVYEHATGLYTDLEDADAFERCRDAVAEIDGLL